jgi:hypothetical protein
MPDAPAPIESSPDVPPQPYDAADDGPIGKWKSVNPLGGPCDMNGKATAAFDEGPGPWKQT